MNPEIAPMIINRMITITLLAITASLTGCASYERRPLALADHADLWQARRLDGETVRAYAAVLAGSRRSEGNSFDLADGVDRHEAEAVALFLNPRLRVMRAAAEVPLAGAREAGWWPDPTVEFEILRFTDRGRKSRYRAEWPSFDGVNTGVAGGNGIEATPAGIRRSDGDYIDDPWIVGASLSLTVPLSGRMAVEKDLAWAQYDVAWRGIVTAEWQFLATLREAWLRWSAVSERLSLTTEYLARLDDVTVTTDRLAAAGELGSTEARLLRIESARLRADRRSLEAEAEQQRLALLAMLGIAPNADVVLVPDLTVPPLHDDLSDPSGELLARHPLVGFARADYEVAEQRLHLEVRKQYPDLSVGPSYSLEEGFTRMGLGLGFPLPLWNRNRQAVAEASADREASRVRAEAAFEVALGELAAARARWSAAVRHRRALIDEAVPLVDQQVAEARQLLELGEVDVLVLREAMNASLRTKENVLAATLDEAVAASAVQHMVRPRWVATSWKEGD